MFIRLTLLVTWPVKAGTSIHINFDWYMYIHQSSWFNDKNAFPRKEKFFFSIFSAVHGRMWEYGHYARNMTVSRMYGYSKLARPFTLLLINFIANYWWGVTYLTRQTAAITLTTSVIMLVWFASIDLASKVRPSSLWKTMLRPYWKSTISNNEKQGKMKQFFTLYSGTSL